MADAQTVEKDAVKPRDEVAFLAQARKQFDRCIEATSDNRKYQLDDLKFAAGSPDNGWQWPPAVLNKRMNDPNGARPTLTNNRLGPHIRLITNEQRKNKPAGRVLPVDGGSDVEVAEVLNGVIRHIHVASHADVSHDTACESQVTIGEGYWRVVTEYCNERSREQDIRIVPVKNSFSVHMDPDGLKLDSVGRKCEYGFVTQKLPTAKYKQEFPKAKSKVDFEALTVGEDTYDWFDDNGVMIAEYFYVEREETKVVFWSDGSATLGGEMPKNVGLEPVDERATTLRHIKWCKINGVEVLEENDWLGKYIPIIRVVGNEWDVEGQLVTSGIVRNAKDPQRMINYWDSQEAEMLALAPKAPYMGAVGQFATKTDDWRDANISNYAYLEYDPIEVNGQLLPPPQRVGPPMAMVGIIEAKRAAADALQSVIGQYNPSLGADAKEKSGIAIRARQNQADAGTYHFQDNLARSIEYETEILLDLIPKVMVDPRRIVRIIGEDGVADTATFNVGQGVAIAEEPGELDAIQKIYDPSVGTYDVVVSTGPSFQTKRTEAAEFLTNAANAAKDPATGMVYAWLSLKSQDWPEAAEAAAMVKKLLPPQVLASDDPNDPAMKEQQLQQAAQALGQREAAVNQATEQAGAVMEESAKQEQAAKDAETKAKDALTRVNGKIGELNAQQETINTQMRELDLLKKLALAELRAEEAESKCAIAEAKGKAEKAISDQQQNQIAERLLGVENKLGTFEVAASGGVQ